MWITIATLCLLAALAPEGALTSVGHADAMPAPAGSPPTAASAAAGESPTLTSPLDASDPVRSFRAQGLIQKIALDGQSMIVQHEEIAGLMPKMTMEFTVRDTNELRNLLPGDHIRFCVRANDEQSWIESIERTGAQSSNVSTAKDPSSSSLLKAARLQPGDKLPDFELIAEDGSTVRLSDFQGRAIAFTFLFTRCLLPDFCPRMNRHFKEARASLLSRTNGSTNWQFVSISFDPDFDRPGVLTRYAYAYRGPSKDRWLFAAAPPASLDSVAPLLDFRFSKENAGFAHNLRTIVLDGDGRIFRQFDGNRWTTEDLVNAMTQAAEAARRR